jgi:hypothetical protein
MSETPQEAQEGVADAVHGLSDNTTVLVRHEIAAVQREMLDQARQARPAIGLLGAAGFFGVLSAAAGYRLSVRLLEKRLPPAAAALVAAAGYGVAAGAAGSLGIQRLRGSRPLVRSETVRQAITTATGTAKAVTGSTAKKATDTAKAADTAKKATTDTVKATAATAAKKATDTAKKAADATAGAATSRTRRQAAPRRPGTSSS